ncbi:MAG: hypothetical protein RR877_01060 [Aurantimicrobium sp.]|uniref:hypothetical protein n=1 Tax=Aurantimicrobium sp. TaxID=1930784 RepID=UPI002FC8D81E
MTAPTVQEKKFDPRKKKGFQKRKQPPLNDQMANKLSELFKISQSNESKQVDHRQQVSTRGLLPLRQEAVDGQDHINFFTNVQTELGALLSTENRLPFAFGPVDKDGKVQGDTFESLKCLWAYYRTSCLIDGFREVQDFKIRKLYRTINEFPKQESIFAVMVLGYYCKMLAYPALADALVNSKLPFDYYSVRNGVKKRTAVSKLMVNALYEVRRALKFKTFPRLESFLSRADQEQASNILPVYRHEYIVNILLSPDAMKKSYYKAIADWPKPQLSKLTIDLGIEKPREQTSNGDVGYVAGIATSAAKVAEARAALDDAAGKLNIPTAVPENGKEGDLLLDDIQKNLEDPANGPKVDSIEERISTSANCAIPSVVDTAAEEVGSADKPIVEESVDLAVKTVSENVVLGSVQLDKATEEVQHQSV